MIIYSVLENNFDYNDNYYYDTGNYSNLQKAFTELVDAENYINELNLQFIKYQYNSKYFDLGISSGKEYTTHITFNEDEWINNKNILIEKFNLNESFIYSVIEDIDVFGKLNKEIAVELFKFLSEKSIIVFNLYKIAECELVNIFS